MAKIKSRLELEIRKILEDINTRLYEDISKCGSYCYFFSQLSLLYSLMLKQHDFLDSYLIFKNDENFLNKSYYNCKPTFFGQLDIIHVILLNICANFFQLSCGLSLYMSCCYVIFLSPLFFMWKISIQSHVFLISWTTHIGNNGNY